MKFNAILSVFAWMPLFAQISVTPVPSTEQQEVVPAFAPYGATTLPAVHVNLDLLVKLKDAEDKKERGDLLVVYDPQTLYYIWRYTPIESATASNSAIFLDAIKAGGEAFYAGANGLWNFSFGGGLGVQVGRQRLANLDAAERAAIDEVRRGPFNDWGYGERVKNVELVKALGRDFFIAPLSPVYHAQRIMSISQQDGNWKLVLRSRWDAEVILDSNFDLVSTKQLTKPQEK